MTQEEKPDFGDWIKSQSGIECMQWPISDPKYLENRLFWAFDAGRDRIWHQYLNQKKQTESAHSDGKKDGWNEAIEAATLIIKPVLNDLDYDNARVIFEELKKLKR